MDVWNSKAIFGTQSDFILESHARLWGLGASYADSFTGGRWTQEEQELHINCLELIAGSFAIRSFTSDCNNCCVWLQMDNVSAIRYINRLSGARSKHLSDLMRDLFIYCASKSITLQMEYLPNTSSFPTDWFSRFWRDASDW